MEDFLQILTLAQHELRESQGFYLCVADREGKVRVFYAADSLNQLEEEGLRAYIRSSAAEMEPPTFKDMEDED